MNNVHAKNYLRDIGSHLERSEELLRAYIHFLKNEKRTQEWNKYVHWKK